MLAAFAALFAAFAVPQPTIVQKPIEHVGASDAQVLGNASQMAASLRLTRWLRCRYSIATRNVIGHAESLSSPYHKERVERLKTQTHGDMSRAAMRTYRSKLAQKGSC
jgi:N-acetylmuramoyl-L-alanine amidase